MRKARIAETAMSAIAGVAVLCALGERPRIGRCMAIGECPQNLASAPLVARKCGEKGEASALLAAVLRDRRRENGIPRRFAIRAAGASEIVEPAQQRGRRFTFFSRRKSRFDRSVSRRTVENGLFFRGSCRAE